MAKKVIGGIGSLLGLKKKKKAPAPAPVEAKKRGFEPIIKQLGSSQARILPLARRGVVGPATILTDKLG